MARPLDIAAVLKNDATALRNARERAHTSHPSDIRAAGNEVENAVRDWLRRILPRKYHVTHGHLIDRELRISPQLDVIIADNEFLPSLLRMTDGTEYVPAEATYAVAEIKSTYSHSARHLDEFCKKLKIISTSISRPEIPNTAKGGMRGDTLLSDMVRGSDLAVHNRLFAFMLCIDVGDCRLINASEEMEQYDRNHTPGVIALLNRGILLVGRMSDRLEYTPYPGLDKLRESPHVLLQPSPTETGSLEGGVLGFLYATLVDHLNKSFLEPVSATPYLRDLLRFSRSGSEGL